jgi:glycine cleavage system H protein
MKAAKTDNKDLYYTADHEWISFQGTVACIGVCHFKLSGFKEVDQIIYNATSGLQKAGETIATLRYNDFAVEVKMPVDGKIMETNPNLIYRENGYLIKHAETDGWIARIIPSQPFERKGLLLPRQYQMNGKSKFLKQ